MSMLPVKFSSSIRDEIINKNFNNLQDQLNVLRLNTTGYGIFDGLNVTLDNTAYKVHISEGHIIDQDGEFIKIPETTWNLDLSTLLYDETESNITLFDNTIRLISVPYASNGKHTAYLHNNKYDITIDGPNSLDFTITGENELTFNEIGSVVNIRYYVAQSVTYTIYIDINNNISIHSSVQSTSPSIYNLSNFKYLLGTIVATPYINGITALHYYENENNRTFVYAKDDKLYVNQNRFANVKFIYTEKPASPQIGDIWYDTTHGQNTLKSYQNFNDIPDWYPVNDYTHINVVNTKLWSPEYASYNANFIDGKHFIFEFVTDRELFCTSDTNALTVIIDNGIINRDQYYEIKLSDAYAVMLSHESDEDISLNNILINSGYTIDNVRALIDSEEYEDQVIGFGLYHPIEVSFELFKTVGSYVEVLVSHTYNTKTVKSKLQRSAIFINEKPIIIDKTVESQTFITDRRYKLGENQLEVYLNGYKLANGIEFVEDVLDDSGYSNSFTTKCSLLRGDILIYKISTNVFIYENDFINSIPKGVINCLIKKGDGLDIIIPNEYHIKNEDYINAVTSEGMPLFRYIEGINDPETKSLYDYEIITTENNTVFRVINNYRFSYGMIIYLSGIRFA